MTDPIKEALKRLEALQAEAGTQTPAPVDRNDTVDDVMVRRGWATLYGAQWGDGPLKWRTRPVSPNDTDYDRRREQVAAEIRRARQGGGKNKLLNVAEEYARTLMETDKIGKRKAVRKAVRAMNLKGYSINPESLRNRLKK